MSRRYGRNQRRRARAEIADHVQHINVLMGREIELRKSLDESRAMRASLARKMHDALSELQAAKAILGHYSGLLNPERIQLDIPETERVCVAPAFQIDQDTLISTPLDVLLMSCEPTPAGALHVLVKFRGGAIRYATSPELIRITPRSVLIDRITSALGPAIADMLTKEAGK